MNAEQEIELKNILDWIIGKFINIINLKPFQKEVDALIETQYQDGIQSSEMKFEMNFIPEKQELNFLKGYVNDNLTNNADQMSQELRGEISRALLNGENTTQLKKRIKDVFKSDKFNARLKTVLRTEALRANNTGALSGAKQSGLDLRKWIEIINDSRTSDICHAEDRKYGNTKKAIPLDDEFIVSVNNKTIRGQAPPFHPNCRSVIRFEEANA